MLDKLNGIKAGKNFFDNIVKLCAGVLGILVVLSCVLFWVLIGLYVQQYLDMSAFFLVCFRFFILTLLISACFSFILHCIYQLMLKKEAKKAWEILNKRNKNGRKK